LLALALAAGFGASGTHAQPSGAQAIHGSAVLTRQGNHLLVTTGNGAGTSHSAINWQSFSIPRGTSTHFAQPSASSTSINRVIGPDPSAILGTLSSNGRLVLVNPAGIAVGAGAVVDTAGFTASTLRMSDADALSGRLRFGDGSGGVLRVDGRVLAREGDVVLIGQQVETGARAVIESSQGATILAAGQKVDVTGRGLEGIVFEVKAPADRALNLGTLRGDAVGVFAGTLRHSGLVQARAVTEEGGTVVLRAVGHAQTEGTIQAQGLDGAGGRVDVLGQTVGVMAGAAIDTSNTGGGGRIRVGGDYQGNNAAVPNAQVTYLDRSAVLRANATAQGDGGRVIVWADDTTRAYGTIEARGGATGGNGGFVETSGKRHLDANGARVVTAAPHGAAGTWLLDPDDLTILGTGTQSPGFTASPFAAAVGGSTILASTINTALNAGSNVVLQATQDVVFGNGTSQNIDLVRTASGSTTLEVQADRDIVFRSGSTTSFRTAGGAGRDLQVNLRSGLGGTGGVRTDSGAFVSMATDNAGSSVTTSLLNGRTWTHDGSLTLNLNGKLFLDNGTTFVNTAGVGGASGALGGVFGNSGALGGTFVNSGTVNLTQGSFLVDHLQVTGGGTFALDGQAISLSTLAYNGGNFSVKVQGDIALPLAGGWLDSTGSVNLQASGSVSVDGSIRARNIGISAGADIYADAPGGRLETFGLTGRSGNVTLTAGGDVYAETIDTSGKGAVAPGGGDVTVDALSVSVTDVLAHGAPGLGGHGGAVRLRGTDYVDVYNSIQTWGSNGTTAAAGGNGGLIHIRAGAGLYLDGASALHAQGGTGGNGSTVGAGGRGGNGGNVVLDLGDYSSLSALDIDAGGGMGNTGTSGGAGGHGGSVTFNLRDADTYVDVGGTIRTAGGPGAAGAPAGATSTVRFNGPGRVHVGSSLDIEGNLTTNARLFEMSGESWVGVTGAATNTGNLHLGYSAVLRVGTYDESEQFIGGTLANAGTLSGHGTVEGSVLNSGTISPGSAAFLTEGGSPFGELTITGDLQQTPTGILQFHVDPAAAPDPGYTHDRLVVSGNLGMDGSIVASAAASEPVFEEVSAAALTATSTTSTTNGPTFEVLQAASVSGLGFPLQSGPTEVVDQLRMNIAGVLQKIPGIPTTQLIAAIQQLLPGVPVSEIVSVVTESFNDARSDEPPSGEDAAPAKDAIVVSDTACRPA
jgi:filamentous hemagglutinin family protein